MVVRDLTMSPHDLCLLALSPLKQLSVLKMINIMVVDDKVPQSKAAYVFNRIFI